MGGLLITAEIQEVVAIAHDALPLLFKQSLELCKVLDDDADGDLAAAHGGQQLVKLIGQGDVRKLVHHEVNGNRERTSVYMVSHIE